MYLMLTMICNCGWSFARTFEIVSRKLFDELPRHTPEGQTLGLSGCNHKKKKEPLFLGYVINIVAQKKITLSWIRHKHVGARVNHFFMDTS